MLLEESLIKYCSPTLAGIKSASLYRFSPESGCQFALHLKLWREWFAAQGLHLTILDGCREKNSYLLYLCRTRTLSRELEKPEVRTFLRSLGYDDTAACDTLLRQLGMRLRKRSGFPHEIGVFLGYPLEDVLGFIENQGKNYTCCGCWKSYGDPRQARRRFSSYRACTAAYQRCYASGMSVAQLTVAV